MIFWGILFSMKAIQTQLRINFFEHWIRDSFNSFNRKQWIEFNFCWNETEIKLIMLLQYMQKILPELFRLEISWSEHLNCNSRCIPSKLQYIFREFGHIFLNYSIASNFNKNLELLIINQCLMTYLN